MKTVYITDIVSMIGEEVELRGWVDRKRDHKKIVFIDLRDKSGVVQVVGGEKFKELSPEDAVKITGMVKKRPDKLVNPKLKTGTVEIEAKDFEIISKAAELPFDMGKDDLNLTLPVLLDYRTLSLRHQKIRSIFQVQSTVVDAFRRHLSQDGFTEVFAPTIVATATEGGAEVFPVQYFDHQAYLAQSPQFYKQIMVGVFEKVFTIAHAYRAEPSVTTRHLTEYVSLDAELGFIDSWLDVVAVADKTMKAIFRRVQEINPDILQAYGVTIPKTVEKTPIIKLKEALDIIYKRTGRDVRNELDMDPEGEREICRWSLDEHGSDMVFVTHFPTKKRAWYSYVDPENPQETLSFDLIGKGLEWISGSQRINNYEELLAKIRKMGAKPENFETYLQAFRYGMPYEGGFAIGLERVTMNILGLSNIREASLFPRDMERVDIQLGKD